MVGKISNDFRISHKGDIQHQVIEGAVRVLDDFRAVDESVQAMKAITLRRDEQQAFATGALVLRYGQRADGQPPVPITADQLNEPRRPEDAGDSLWSTFQRIQ